MVFRDVQIEYTGGGTADDTKLAVRQPGVDARKLPVWGFFVRGVHDLTLDRVSLALRQPDRRPVLMADSVERLRLREFRYPEPQPGIEPLTLTRVERLERE